MTDYIIQHRINEVKRRIAVLRDVLNAHMKTVDDEDPDEFTTAETEELLDRLESQQRYLKVLKRARVVHERSSDREAFDRFERGKNLMIRYRSSSPYGLMGSFNPMRETLKRVFKEDDRLNKKWEREEWERRSKEKAPVVAPAVETVSANDPRIIKRSHSDGIERVWIVGWSRSKYLIHALPTRQQSMLTAMRCCRAAPS